MNHNYTRQQLLDAFVARRAKLLLQDGSIDGEMVAVEHGITYLRDSIAKQKTAEQPTVSAR